MFNETINNQKINITVNEIARLDTRAAAQMMGVSEKKLKDSRNTGAIDGMPAPTFSVSYHGDDDEPRFYYTNIDIMYWLLTLKQYVAHSDDMKELYTKERHQKPPYQFKAVPFLK